MKKLFGKLWFKGALIAFVSVVTFLIHLWILSLNLKGRFAGDTIFSLAKEISRPNIIIIYSFALTIAFYAFVIPLILSVFSILRKKNVGLSINVFYSFAFELALIGYQLFYSALSVFAVVLIIINIVLTLFAAMMLFLRSKAIHQVKDEVTQKQTELSQTKVPTLVLIMLITSILVMLTFFFIPIYALNKPTGDENVILITVLFLGAPELENNIYFLVYFGLFLAALGFLARSMTTYFNNKEKFVQKAGNFINFAFITSLSFFLVGLVNDMYFTTLERPDFIIHNYSFIPMILMLVVIFIYAILKGKLKIYVVANEKKPAKYYRFEPLLYLILMTAVSIGMLLLPVVSIDITSGSYEHQINLTGFEILRDYASLEQGYHLVAYLIVVMFISVGLVLIITLTAYLSKFKNVSSMIKFSTGINFLFIFLFAISGYYFQIAKEINQSIIYELAAFYGLIIPESFEFDYVVGTKTIIALFAAVAILMAMFLRKAFDKEEDKELQLASMPFEQEVSNGKEKKLGNDEQEIVQAFDPCPAFTELDSKKDAFDESLDHRKKYQVKDTSLSELVTFVVEYAKNSRLHLSYTQEDIATFVAGLGASKLSILQGMSGTGKTSLPKIFSEAVFGNCEIVEVESSWKDKNELLGYYNEFSMKYTPKKFTLALYKAALNPEVFTFILLDEMNLSRIEYYFSDFLSLMEHEENKRFIKLINIKLARTDKNETTDYLALEQGHTLAVPPNVWFIGTANRDESTFVISDKVYDRATTMNFTKRAPKVRNYSNPISQRFYDYRTIQNLFNKAKESNTFDAENNEIIKHVETLLTPFNISFGNRILKQIEEFVVIYKACFPNEDVENEAVEAILLSKVVAKLEVKTIEDKEKLVMDFLKLNLNRCAAFIKHLDNE